MGGSGGGSNRDNRSGGESDESKFTKHYGSPCL
jgi:hypothetical protein